MLWHFNCIGLQVDRKYILSGAMVPEAPDVPLDQAMENPQDEVVYQCGTCQFVLTQKRDDPPPSYCPRCAVNQLKGAMLPVARERGHAGGTGS